MYSSVKSFNRILIGWVLYCFLLSIYSYFADCIFHFKYAIGNLSYLPMYFITHMIFHIYLLLPAIFLYVYLFKDRKGLVALKVLFAVIIATGICLFLYSDDYSLYIGEYKKVKQILSYVFAGISVIFLDEFDLLDKVFKREKKQRLR